MSADTGSRHDEWVRWLIGSAMAGAVAYGAVARELGTMETALRASIDRAAEDRAGMQRAVENLSKELTGLREELHDEESARRASQPAVNRPRFESGERFSPR